MNKLFNRKNAKKESAITLVALVVTIIVLLILAGVSLNIILGENRYNTKSQRSCK